MPVAWGESRKERYKAACFLRETLLVGKIRCGQDRTQWLLTRNQRADSSVDRAAVCFARCVPDIELDDAFPARCFRLPSYRSVFHQ